jgi:hypothetical protein
VEWFTYHDMSIIVSASLTGKLVPQVISVMADVQALVRDIPTPPETIPPEYGPPGPVQQWSGRVGHRLFTVECEARDSPHESVLIRTGFLQTQDELGDWVALLELQQLPTSVFITRPLFVESRNVHPKCVVYRPDARGWNTAVYKAASETEAEKLLAFMKQDAWNEKCFVGEPPPPGKWVIVQGERVLVGKGSELNEALMFACEWSLRYGSTELLVKDSTGTSKEVYVVSQGRVLQPPEGKW